MRPEATAVWADPKVYPPPNRAIYFEIARTGARLPVHPAISSSQYGPILTTHQSQIYAGQEPAADGLRAAQTEINALIANAGPIPRGFAACPRVPGV
ncbi:MAG: hypothetical protein ACRDJN_25000 [Chloroflexota bacterium]